MEWQISYLSDEDIMLVKVTGAVRHHETLPMIRVIREEAQRLNCTKWLLDSRTAVLYYSTIDYYNCPDVYDSLDISSAVSGAVVFENVGRQERFYETVCRNRGFNLSVFSDIDGAITWLTSVHEDGSHRI